EMYADRSQKDSPDQDPVLQSKGGMMSIRVME
ncbi:septum site-determining protein MinC, partial [Pseudomonas sp. MWU12-2115]